MQYTQLGNTGLVVSRLGFGAATFTQGNQSISTLYKVGAELAGELVARCLDAGVTLFDTSDVYADGESETLLGQALKGRREQVVLTTKVGNRSSSERDLNRGNLSRRNILQSVDDSLRRLGTDWIDLYVAHREDLYTPLEETLEAFDAVVRAGKVRYLGFSNWSAWRAAAAIEIQRANHLAPFSHGQMYYSLLGRDVERDLLPMLRHYGAGMTVWGPLAFGFLSGAYSREDLSKPDNRFSNFDMLKFDREQAFALLPLLRDLASARGISVAQLSIAWLLAKPGVSSVLMGATKRHQIDDNLGAADIVLDAAELQQLDAATTIRPQYPSSDWIQPDFRMARALGLPR